MNKKIISIIIIAILIFIGFEILTSSDQILNSVKFSLSIWYNNIFPSLFPFFVLSELLVNYGFIELVGELLKPIMIKIFKTDSKTAFIFVMSLISGFPSNAKYTRELYQNNLIDQQQATKILTFTHFSNPLFILGTLSLVFLNNKEVGLLILVIHYLTNIIIGILFRNYYPTKETNSKVSIKKAIDNMHTKRLNNHKNFGVIITSSLLNTINTLLLILGVVTMFLVLTTIIDNNINLNNYNQSILNGFVEMTQGLKYISVLNIPLKFKATLSTMILSFGGLSVHMQIIGILSDTDIEYLPFLTARLLHAAIASITLFILFDFLI
ncbi:MAG: nucleoside recognition domain-containing protein [Bacilli bacterium]